MDESRLTAREILSALTKDKISLMQFLKHDDIKMLRKSGGFDDFVLWIVNYCMLASVDISAKENQEFISCAIRGESVLYDILESFLGFFSKELFPDGKDNDFLVDLSTGPNCAGIAYTRLIIFKRQDKGSDYQKIFDRVYMSAGNEARAREKLDKTSLLCYADHNDKIELLREGLFTIWENL